MKKVFLLSVFVMIIACSMPVLADYKITEGFADATKPAPNRAGWGISGKEFGSKNDGFDAGAGVSTDGTSVTFGAHAPNKDWDFQTFTLPPGETIRGMVPKSGYRATFINGVLNAVKLQADIIVKTAGGLYQPRKIHFWYYPNSELIVMFMTDDDVPQVNAPSAIAVSKAGEVCGPHERVDGQNYQIVDTTFFVNDINGAGFRMTAFTEEGAPAANSTFVSLPAGYELDVDLDRPDTGDGVLALYVTPAAVGGNNYALVFMQATHIATGNTDVIIWQQTVNATDNTITTDPAPTTYKTIAPGDTNVGLPAAARLGANVFLSVIADGNLRQQLLTYTPGVFPTVNALSPVPGAVDTPPPAGTSYNAGANTIANYNNAGDEVLVSGRALSNGNTVLVSVDALTMNYNEVLGSTPGSPNYVVNQLETFLPSYGPPSVSGDGDHMRVVTVYSQQISDTEQWNWLDEDPENYTAINPNGTTRFTTDKYVSIETMNPDINILNFRLGWQNYSGTFDTSAGTCSGCTFDLDNLTCQAEVEKIFGMFVTYNLTINLTPDRTLNFTALNLLCRDGNETVTAHPGCLGLFSAYPNGITSTGCMQWINSTYATTFSNGLAIDLHNLTTSIEFNMGTLTPTPTCEMIACELNGTWEPGRTQEFTINKTITVTAN